MLSRRAYPPPPSHTHRHTLIRLYECAVNIVVCMYLMYMYKYYYENVYFYVCTRILAQNTLACPFSGAQRSSAHPRRSSWTAKSTERVLGNPRETCRLVKGSLFATRVSGMQGHGTVRSTVWPIRVSICDQKTSPLSLFLTPNGTRSLTRPKAVLLASRKSFHRCVFSYTSCINACMRHVRALCLAPRIFV